uniref:receptor protein-tyrosine kinase n=2 Tax=Lygus hesperus TaxID=30085 RepID=A0A146L3H9_LYGHE
MARMSELPCALCFLVLISPTVIQGLTITPAEKEMTIASGSTIELLCEDDQPVEWSYETLEEETPPANIIKTSDGNRAMLTIVDAYYMNVKLYRCSSITTKEEESIYIFVRDVAHLLVSEEDQNIFSFYTSEDVIVPCKPSFPEVKVELQKVDDSEILDYNNKLGFTVRLNRAKHIECVGTLMIGSSAHSTKIMYEAELMQDQPEDINTPDIELVGGGPDDHVTVGQNVTLRCSLMGPPGVHHDFFWTKPKTISPEDDRFVVDSPSVRTKYPSNSNQPYNLATSNLFIHNVRKGDEGSYKCTVSAGNQESSFAYIFKVFDNAQVFLNVTPVGSLTYTSRPGKSEVVLVALIAAHPIPVITWYGPDGRKIAPNKKYNITGDMESTHLIVYSPTTSDIGNYTLKARNKAGEKVLHYMLHIEGEPLIEIPESSKAYLLKTKQNLTCRVVGYPRPKVEMSFRPCPSLEECSAVIPLHAIGTCQNPPVSCNYTATLSITHQGNFSCSAYNRLGKGSATSFIHITDIPNEFHVYNNSMGNGKISDLDPIVLECGASKNSYMNDLVWKFKRQGEIPIVLEEEVLEERDGIIIKHNETDLSYWSKLNILHPRINQSGIYTCSAHFKKDHSITSFSTIINVLPSVAPSFNDVTGNNSHHDVSPGGPLTWYCNASGNPLPSYSWYKNGRLLTEKDSSIRFRGVFDIKSVQGSDEGTYRCVASNKKGSASLVFNLKIKKKEGIIHWIVISVSTIVILVFIAIVIYQRRKIKQEKKAREEVFPADLYFIREGNVEYLNPNLDIADQAEFLPYNQAWEFPIEKLKLGKQLGFGAFGVVMKAEATGLRNDEEKTIVAVKMVKKNADVDLIKALASELKIMANLGQHVNVVNLLGACTRNIANRELLVIVEFCKFGNLHDFLLTHRDSFINQVNPGSGNLEIIPSDNSMGFPIGVSRSNSNYRGGSGYNTAGSNCATVTTDMTVLSSTPIGEDGYLLNKELSQHYQGDFQQTEKKTICTQDLLCWGFQIAKGMEYLASRKVLHGDLAARNVLLADNNVVKICDFGLAKSMYKKEIYTKAGNELLPIKWMSIEALEDRVFSTQSDIWAYGIVLWELFTLSRTPYPGVQPSDILTLLRSGYRMEKPEYATEDVYNVMIESWNKSPMLRPSFTECAERLGNMLEESVKQHFMDLNNPYVEFNSNQPVGRDYLSILNPPTYVNCTSDHSEGNVGNDYTPMHRYKNDRDKDAVELRPMLPQPGS